LQQGLYEGAYALLSADGSLEIFVTALEAESAQQSNTSIHIYTSIKDLYRKLHDSLKSLKTIGLNYSRIRLSDFSVLVKEFPEISFIDVSTVLQTTRLIKDTNELDRIRQACLITDKVMTILPELIHTDITEEDLAAEINYCLQKFGAAHPAFDTISSFGPHSAEPHYTHGETGLCKNDFIVCDFGATYQRYHADLTRTFINGAPTTEQKEMHSVVHHAQEVGFDAIQPGIKAKQVHEAVAKVIDGTSFKGKFIHSTGHSLGLLVHDGPGFTSENSLILKENMVFTVEPGVYLSGIGGVRIEDNIRVTQNGLELLSNSPRELIEIKG
jgi:Xaa-Pro dipeptidase